MRYIILCNNTWEENLRDAAEKNNSLVAVVTWIYVVVRGSCPLVLNCSLVNRKNGSTIKGSSVVIKRASPQDIIKQVMSFMALLVHHHPHSL